MPTVTLTNIPEDLHRRLQERAAQHGRSLDREILACLEEATAPSDASREALLARIRARRARMQEAGLHLSEADVQAAIEEGRP